MRVLMHCVYLPPEVGGLESHVYYLCRALVEMGHEVDAVTSRSRDDLPRFEILDGIRVWRTWLPARNTAGWAAHSFFSMPRFGALAQQADILHAQDIAAVLPCMVAGGLSGTPFVTTYHTSHFLERAESPFWRPIFRRFLEAADHNLAASVEISQVAASLAPGVEVEALTNGVETDFFRPVEPAIRVDDSRVLIVPRRLFPKNGVEYFIRAMPLILERINVKALIVGDGPERERLDSLASQLGVSDRVSFLGARPNDEMPGLLCSAELAIFPSLMEATSVAALESMACGVPVAASRVGGLPEIVDSEVGALFEAGDPAALASTVVQLMERGELRSLGAEARRRVVERWSNARLAERHLEIYEQLVAKRRAA